MQITDFQVVSSCTPSNTIIYGTSYSIRFTVRREASDDFYDRLYVWLATGGYGEVLAYFERDFSLAVGENCEISVTSERFLNSGVESFLNDSRALQASSWGVQFGPNGTRKNVVFPVNIVQGWLPRIDRFSALRCTDGVENDEGEELLCGLKLSTSALADPGEMSLVFRYANGTVTAASPSVDLSESVSEALDGIEDSADLIGQTFSNGMDWNFMLAFGDAYEQAVVYCGIPRAFANIHLSGCSTGGVAFGRFSSASEGNPKFECEYPAFFSGAVTFGGGISGVMRMETGTAAVAERVGSGMYKDFPVTFAEAFHSAPTVFCGFVANITSSGFGNANAAVYDVTTTGCVLRVYNSGGSAYSPDVVWLALGN